MYELAWFVGGAITYQLLSRLLRITQLYMLFQEIHIHIIMMLQAASHDLEVACDLKLASLEESELSEDERKTIKEMDNLAVVNWKENAARKICNHLPSVFRTIVQYDSWDGMNKYLNDITKK